MNTEQERAELLPCPFCGGSVSFHQDDEECREGCHYIECKTCGMFDLSATADPNNQIESLSDLRDRIAPLWNRRAALQSQSVKDGWKEAAIAWEVCASLHREFCKGRDPLFKVRQSDFVKHAEDARTRALETEALQSQDREDAGAWYDRFMELSRDLVVANRALVREPTTAHQKLAAEAAVALQVHARRRVEGERE